MTKKGRHQAWIERIVCHELDQLIKCWNEELEERRKEKKSNMTPHDVQASTSFAKRRNKLLERIRYVCKRSGLTRDQATELIDRITSQVLRKSQ